MKAEIERIMDLQPLWDHRKTPEMDERGKLVRANGPNWLRDFAEELAGEIGIPVTDLLVEGRDGTGPKTEVPWFRFASKERSPSATTDWYCVYLFDTQGEAAYLSLGHGSTDWTGVDFRPRPADELRALGQWGRDAVGDIAGQRPDLSPSMSLHSRRSPLGPADEAKIAEQAILSQQMLDAITVERGDRVEIGQPIGVPLGQDEWAHVHMTVKQSNSQPEIWLCPMDYMAAGELDVLSAPTQAWADRLYNGSKTPELCNL
ncbi:MAG: MrcB family domain-containing protein [Ilumatobacteraceae bacterium]